jgi:O-antigen/teichoic acid export membrane protein
MKLTVENEELAARRMARDRGDLLSSDESYLPVATGFGFVRQVLATYATQIVCLLISLLTTAIVSRVLGPDGRGQYAVAVVIGLMGVQVCNLGLHASNTYLAARRPHTVPTLLTNSLAASFGLGGVAAVCIWLAFSIRPQWEPVRGSLFLLSLIWIPLGLAYLLIQNLLMGIQRVRAYNVVELVRRLLGILFIGVALLFRRTTPTAFFVVLFLALVGGSLWALRELWRFAPRLSLPSLALFQEGIGIGVRAYLASFFAFLVIRSDLLIVKYMLGAKEAGYYSVAGSLADCILLLPAAIGMVLLPKLSAMQPSEAGRRWVSRITLGASALLLPVVILATLLAHPIIHILFGDAFQPAASALMLLMPGVFFLGVETVMVQYLNSFGFPGSIVWTWLVTCGLNIGLNFFVVPRYGIAGASIVSSVCYTLAFLLIYLILHNSNPESQALPASSAV